MSILNQGTHHHCTVSSFISLSCLVKFYGVSNFYSENKSLGFKQSETPSTSDGLSFWIVHHSHTLHHHNHLYHHNYLTFWLIIDYKNGNILLLSRS